MRVNHAGEISAQGLYQGHAAVARDESISQQMQAAADEELDHLAWCEQRLAELDASPSRISPLWYAGSFAIGAASGLFGDKWSLGFIAETERQVCDHLSSHLKNCPTMMKKAARSSNRCATKNNSMAKMPLKQGAAELPEPVRQLMRLTSKIMTKSAYRF